MVSCLVIGADGLIGRALMVELKGRRWNVVGTTRRSGGESAGPQLDLARSPLAAFDDPRLARIVMQRPFVFLAAAVTGFTRCAEEPEATRFVNVTNTVAVAEQLVEQGAFVLYLSSTAVFGDWSGVAAETSAPRPASEYGRQKADCESALLGVPERTSSVGAGIAVVRLTKVVHRTGLIGTWVRALADGGEIEAASDLILSPISLRFVMAGLVRVAQTRRSGIYHLSGDGALSYYDFARELAASLEVDPSRVRPVQVRTRPDLVATSNAGAMAMMETSQRIGLAAQPSRSAIRDLLEEEPGPDAR